MVREKIEEAKINLNKKKLSENYQKWYNLGIERIDQKRWKDAVENFNKALEYATTANEKSIAREKLKEAKTALLNEEKRIRAIASFKNTINPELTKPKTSSKHQKAWMSGISTTASLLLIVILSLLLLSSQLNPIMAKIYLWQKNYDRAISIYEKAISKDKKVWLYPLLASIYLRLDRMDEAAMRVYDRAVYLNPNSRKMTKILADYYIKENRTGDRAIEIYEDALKFDPDNTRLLNILGNAYFNRGNDKKATDIYRKLYNMGQADELVISNLSKIYLKECRLDDEAILIYEETLEYESENHDLIIALSQAYLNKGMKDRRTIEIYRKSVGLCSNLVRSYKEKNDLDKAKQYAEIACKIVYCYSIAAVDTLIRDSVMGVLNKW